MLTMFHSVDGLKVKLIYSMISQHPAHHHWQMLPSGYLTVCHGSHGPNRNSWFTELKNGGSFHGYE